MGVAFVFPGQNSHFVGMGKDLCEAAPAARAVFEAADDVLGFRLTRLMFEGPEEQLTATENQQPAIVAHSLACLAALDGQLRPSMVAGHSLGEYSAVVAAKALSLEEGLLLVRRRGEFMAQAGGGAMAAVLGLDSADVERACEMAREVGEVTVANRNCPGQVVISGAPDAVDEVSRLLREGGAKRVVPLRVTGAFHSRLMQPVADEFGPVLLATPFSGADVPVVSNVDAVARRDPEAIRGALSRQIVSSVQWEASVHTMIDQGIDTFVEIGPGQVLTGLIRRISRDVTVHATGSVSAIQKLAL